MSTVIRPIPQGKDMYIKERGKPCYHREHNPPNMIVIPPGNELIHTCPGCGKVTTIRSYGAFWCSAGGQ